MKTLFLASEIHMVAEQVVAKISAKLKKSLKEIKTAFIYTAAEPDLAANPGEGKQWIKENRQGLVDAGLDVFDYTIANKTPEQLEKDLGDADVIHVNGGNTFYFVLQARKSGFDKFIKKQLEKGVIYTGSSAGSISVAPDIEIAANFEIETYKGELKTTKGLGLVDFIILPHWGNDYFREQYLNKVIKGACKEKHKIILLNDYQYVQVENVRSRGDQVEGDFYKIVDVREDY